MLPRYYAEWASRSCSSRRRRLWGVALLFVFLVPRATCMSDTAELQLEARSTNISSQKECFPVHWDEFRHSSWTPQLIDQISEYTMWQQFCIINSTANFNPQTWSRQPYKLSYSKDRYHYNKTLHPYVTEDGRVCVNASITMYNLQGEIDNGDYKTVVSTTCSSSEMIFQLRIAKCGIKDVPRPIQPTPEPLIVPEVNGQGTLTWKYMFYGDNRLTDYIFRVMKSGEIVCDESSPGSHDHFKCTREIQGMCNVTITTHVQNYTHKDSGEYCAAAYPTGGPNLGNDSCLKFVVVQQPVVEPVHGKSRLDLFKGASLVYNISKYSEYVNTTFIKDERKIIDPSGNGYKLDLQYNATDNTTVTMTLHMTGNPNHAGRYTLCTSLVIDTSTLNCTISVSVSKGLWIGEVAGCITGALLVIILIFTLYCCHYWYMHKRRYSGDCERDGPSNDPGTSGRTSLEHGRDHGTSEAHKLPRNRQGYTLLTEESDPPAEDIPDHEHNNSPTFSVQHRPLLEIASLDEYNSTQSASTSTEAPPVWQKIPDTSLPFTECQLQRISEQLTDYKHLARYLGLDDPTIAGISENYRTFEEQKYQMLYTWSQRKGDDATLKALLQCVEVDCRDRELAQRIVDALRNR